MSADADPHLSSMLGPCNHRNATGLQTLLVLDGLRKIPLDRFDFR
jgi:hypothetical protein